MERQSPDVLAEDGETKTGLPIRRALDPAEVVLLPVNEQIQVYASAPEGSLEYRVSLFGAL